MTLVQLNCTPDNTWRVWLELDGVLVPGSYTAGFPDNAPLRPLTLTGVTAGQVAAGEHVVRIAADCSSSSLVGADFAGSGAATAIVLG
jgi:hypothetical protein